MVNPIAFELVTQNILRINTNHQSDGLRAKISRCRCNQKKRLAPSPMPRFEIARNTNSLYRNQDNSIRKANRLPSISLRKVIMKILWEKRLSFPGPREHSEFSENRHNFFSSTRHIHCGLINLSGLNAIRPPQNGATWDSGGRGLKDPSLKCACQRVLARNLFRGWLWRPGMRLYIIKL